MKIDYEQIEQDFPKAFGVFKNSKYYWVSEPLGYICFDDRDLYDFFDEQELFVSIYISDYWCWDINTHTEELAVWTTCYHTRTEAEACAFNTAFKLLEETL